MIQRWCCYQICQITNNIHRDSDMMLCPNLPKSQYHPLWCRDDAITKSAKEPIPSIVIQRWHYYQICQRANIIQCIAEMMLLPNLPKSQYHPLCFRDDDVTESAKEPIPSIVIQRWWCYQICQRANTIHCDSEMMMLPNLPKSKYRPLWFRDNAITKSAKEQIPSIVLFVCLFDSLGPINNLWVI